MAMRLGTLTLHRLLGKESLKVARNQSLVRNASSGQPHMFTWARIKKNYELMPLVIIIGGAVVGLCGYIVYSSRTRPDVVFRKHGKPLQETMDLLNPKNTKMITFNQQYPPMAEINEIYSAMEEKKEAE